MSIEKHIHRYLKSMKKYLSRLEQADANEVLKEIESHIFDAVEALEAKGESVDIESILAGFGAPRELAAQYVDHVLMGSPPPAGFNTIKKITRGVTKGLWLSMAIFGHLIAGLLAVLGVLKVIFSDQVGLWVAAHGHSVIIAFADNSFPKSDEVLGWWLVPLALTSSVLVLILTRKVLKGLRYGMT